MKELKIKLKSLEYEINMLEISEESFTGVDVRLNEVKSLVKKLIDPVHSKSFTAEEVGNILATKFSTIEESIHYFDTI